MGKNYILDPQKIAGVDVVLHTEFNFDGLFAPRIRDFGQPEMAPLSRYVTLGLGLFGALRHGRLICISNLYTFKPI